MRIAVLCPGYDRIPRGIETVVSNVFNRLSKKYNYKIDIYTGAESRDIDLISHINVPLIDYQSELSKKYSKLAKKINLVANEPYDFEFLTFSIGLLFKLFKVKYDIIFNEAGLFTGYICKLYRLIYNTPFVHSGHAGINKLEKKIASQSPDIYIASTPFAGNWIKSIYPDMKVEIIPNGIDFELFKPDKKNVNLLSNKLDSPCFLYVGELQKQKRVDLLINSLSEIQNTNLMIIGDGPEKDRLLKLCADKLYNRYVQIDYVEFNKLPDYFNYCDYFIMPSKGEAFGIVYIMALGCNKPVIADCSEVQKWIIQDGGLTCDCSNLTEFRNTILKMMSTDFENKPYNRSRYFSWDQIVDEYYRIIQKLT